MANASEAIVKGMNSGMTLTARSRFKAELGLKLLLMVVLNLIVFVPYGYFQRHHFFPTLIMSGTFIDKALPFLDWTVVVYLSIYLLMPIGPFLLVDRKMILRYAAGVIFMGFVADVIFLFLPTVCERPQLASANPIYSALVKVDMPFHAFPSLHAAFAVYSAFCGVRVMKELDWPRAYRSGVWTWTGVILFATLTTKQHVVVDLAGGTALAMTAYYLFLGQWNTRQHIAAHVAIPESEQLVD